ncbi:MAG: shikimate dehydrogenase [Halomonadaceae bacterium]|nr:MAG: shikimate dehydrogenase [Halomonadaceae bacterium]
MPHDRYAVVGNPISHSKSPLIHQAFARQTGEQLTYERLEGPLEGFADWVTAFFDQGGAGLNVTVPFKQQAWELAQVHSERAATAAAVNTLYRDQNGRLVGDNTDGAGLVRDLTHNHGVSLAGARILLLGAGGAVRGVLTPLLAQAPASLTIANRTPAKAEALCSEFAGKVPLHHRSFAELVGPFDLIINGTSASLQGDLPPLPEGLLAPGASAYDMMYSQNITPFNQWAKAQGAAKTLDGLGMLVEQAAESFRLWRGRLPDTAPVIARLRAGET